MASEHPRADSQPLRNLPGLTLHVPEPKFRPGDPVDFAEVDVPPAGQARRPDTADKASDFTDLAYTLVRVLDDEGHAVGPWDPKLSPDMLRRMLRSMALLRAFDERMFRAQRQGKTSFYMKALGEEAVVSATRARANRLANADHANIVRTSRAAGAQLRAIRRLEREGRLDELAPELKEVARLRVRHPTLSLRELARRCSPPATKAATYRRLSKLQRLAEL